MLIIQTSCRLLFVTVCDSNMSLDMRKPVFGVCDQVRLKPICSTAELLSCRSQLDYWNLVHRNCRYYAISGATNKGADQTAQMRKLICTFVVRIWHKTGCRMTRPKLSVCKACKIVCICVYVCIVKISRPVIVHLSILEGISFIS